MDLNSTRDFMITNSNLNTMLKPNNIKGSYTISNGMNSDAGIQLLNGKINHHTSMVFDIIYDHMYRMFNQFEGTEYIASSLSRMLSSHDGHRHDYFTKLLTDRKLDFFFKVKQLISLYVGGTSIDYSKDLRDFLLYSAPDIINNAFEIEFSVKYKSALETRCEQVGNFDEVMELLKNFKFENRFYMHLLGMIFYGKIPSWNEFYLDIDLNSIFENKERSVYNLKNWFQDTEDIKLSLTYPVTCIFDQFGKDLKYVPKKIFLKSCMFAIEEVDPLYGIKFNKSKMDVKIPLVNKFMVFMAHDAKLCVKNYVPSKLYSMNSNAFFIGKNILNNNYYNKGTYTNKLNYKINELFKFLNLSNSDDNNGNISYRKKSIYKALDQLDSNEIIKIDKLNSEQVKLSYVWNIIEPKIFKPRSVDLDGCKKMLANPVDSDEEIVNAGSF